MPTAYKICSSCTRRLALDKFGTNNQSPDGHHWYCKECAAEKQRKWKHDNQAKVKKWRKRYLKRIKEANDART